MNLGFPEMIFLFLLALIIFGPKKLPEIGRQVGRALNEFKRASNEFRAQIEAEIAQIEVAPKQEILPPAQPPAGSVASLSGSGLQHELVESNPVVSGTLVEPEAPVEPAFVVHPEAPAADLTMHSQVSSEHSLSEHSLSEHSPSDHSPFDHSVSNRPVSNPPEPGEPQVIQAEIVQPRLLPAAESEIAAKAPDA